MNEGAGSVLGKDLGFRKAKSPKLVEEIHIEL
jgi:hypothetical protein